MENFNFDENSINKLKEMMNKGDLSDVISKIPPEMLKNFSDTMSSNQKKATNDSNKNNSSNNSNNFDFSNLDINTIMKMKSVMEKMNNTNDPRSNLLNSLKPYLREERKGKLDQYSNIMNIAKIAELLNNKENNSNV